MIVWCMWSVYTFVSNLVVAIKLAAIKTTEAAALTAGTAASQFFVTRLFEGLWASSDFCGPDIGRESCIHPPGGPDAWLL